MLATGKEVAVAEKPVIKVAAICGSLRKASYNRGLIRAAMELSKEQIEGVHVEYIDISALPMLNTDLEVDGRYPVEVEAFREKVLEADCCLFASPDYNYSITQKKLFECRKALLPLRKPQWRILRFFLSTQGSFDTTLHARSCQPNLLVTDSSLICRFDISISQSVLSSCYHKSGFISAGMAFQEEVAC